MHRKVARLMLALCVLAAAVQVAVLADAAAGGIESDEVSRADFVIVGAGTAGCALAARLCENLPHSTVALLERGHPRNADEELRVRAVRNAFQAWRDPGVAESWPSEPNRGLLDRRVTQVTGNTLGGTSSIGAAHWTKPPLHVFDTDAWSFSGT